MSIAGPAGRIEAVLEIPSRPEPAAALVCHPHPLHGGNMQNKVTHTIARALVALGAPTVRFNFRGVGQSDGEYADGLGELEDAIAVADWVSSRWPQTSLWVGGFSFGAMVATRVATERETSQLITVAPPVQRMDPATLRQPECPWLVIQGAEDELVDVDAVVDWINALAPGPELIVLEGVDHFFHGRLRELRDTLTANLSKTPNSG